MKHKKNYTRIPLPAGTTIPVAGTDIRIRRDGENEEYSAGSSCLVYRGHIVSGTGVVTGMHVIIKEFYPASEDLASCASRNPDGSLRFLESAKSLDAYKATYDQFQQALQYQTALAGSNAMEVSVRPLFVSSWGDTSYVISDAHRGVPLEKTSASLRDKLAVAVSFAEAMGILHESGYIMTDIKPENFLWVRKPNSIRIIDTDSLIPFHDPERLTQQPIFSNKNHWSPELKFLDIKMREGTSRREMDVFRQTLLNPNSDRYAMGIFLFEMFFGRLPETAGRDACLTSGAALSTGLAGSAAGQTSGPSAQNDEPFQSLLRELRNRYGEEITHAGRRTAEILLPLLQVLGRLLIQRSSARKRNGYSDDNVLVSDLQTIYAQFTTEKLVLRRETAKANARFAAYNLLQKYPLFEYPAKSGNGGKSLSVAIIGTHAMRPDMLAAVLSIGQMPEMPLHIRLIAPDADRFWEEYVSEKNNPALAHAVTVEYKNKSDDLFDAGLVDQPLAHISICRQDGVPLQENPEESALLASAGDTPEPVYFILLEEEPQKRNAWIRYLTSHPSLSQKRIMIGYLSFENGTDRIYTDTPDGNATLYAISAESFTEEYSEKMFSEKIYSMGLMAHAYYCKAISGENDGAPVDMKKLEEEFQSDVYSISSSERCALHGTCKLAGLGIDRNSPGRFLRFYKKIQDPQILEKLAWSEHLSWTAFMLTSGAVPVSMDEFGEYAYREGNDWKDKTDGRHIRHPLLAASSLRPACTLRGIERTEDVTPEIYGQLDPLDRVSVRIARWYAAKRDLYRERYLEWSGRLQALCTQYEDPGSPAFPVHTEITDPEEDKNRTQGHPRMPERKTAEGPQKTQELLDTLKETGLSCIQLMGEYLTPQDPQFRRIWEETAGHIAARFRERDDIRDLLDAGRKTIMKAAFDSLEDRDFKQNDRDLAYAVMDIIA